jgi:LemA protein
MRRGLWVAIAALVVVFLAVLLVFGSYVSAKNQMVQKRETITSSWAEVNNQLQRRADLIPNLVETVKGYASHEKETLERVVQARNMAMNARSVSEQAQAENMLSGTLKTLFAVAEAYPDLKANQNFMGLQEELKSTENRIGFARQHYNDVVSQYNTSLQTFPANVVGGMFGFRPSEFFKLDAAEAAAVQKAPQVKF